MKVGGLVKGLGAAAAGSAVLGGLSALAMTGASIYGTVKSTQALDKMSSGGSAFPPPSSNGM